ncbi:MAG: cell wall hydrolase [Maricaulaceae bacterium]
MAAIVTPLAADRIEVQQQNADWRVRGVAMADALNVAAMASNDVAPRVKPARHSGERLAKTQLTAQLYRASARDAFAVGRLQTFASSHFAEAARQTRGLNCLAEAVYYEARSESFVGQLAVAEVVLNRVRHRAYPNSICEVVYQGEHRATGCQFSFACDGSNAFAPFGAAWSKARKVAAHALLDLPRSVTRRATHYHTIAVSPVWSGRLERTGQIGEHIFYRFPTRGRDRTRGDA